MKLSHLSIAILAAISLAACGGGSSNQVTPENDGKAPKPAVPEEPTKPEVSQDDKELVNPTKDEAVVDAISLADQSSVGAQQYLRGEQSDFDKTANPDKAASATVIDGLSLDKQNPQLTNIVIARVEGKNDQGEAVRIAQYLGSPEINMPSIDNTNTDALQLENDDNALVISHDIKVLSFNPVVTAVGTKIQAQQAAANDYVTKRIAYEQALEAFKANPQPTSNASGTGKALADAADALYKLNSSPRDDIDLSKASAITTLNTRAKALAVDDLNSEKVELTPEAKKLGFKTHVYDSFQLVSNTTINKYAAKYAANGNNPTDDDLFLKKNGEINTVNVTLLDSATIGRPFGNGLFVYAYDNNTQYTGYGFGDMYDANAVGKVVPVAADGTNPTTGLVAIYQDLDGDTIVRGSEATNNRTTRIFGHYYLDPRSVDGINLNREAVNSWKRPQAFITGLNPANDKANKWGLGVEPQILDHVQYGRVTAKIAAHSLAQEAATVGWKKEQQQYAAHDNTKKLDADDFYFYRGTGATKVEEMAKLPTDAKISYEGHALMYGIDNAFHGEGLNLPNAFGNENKYGLGNFVKAELDMSAKTFSGSVFNAWHSEDVSKYVEDTLVKFEGNVKGNTVIGEASRTYVDETAPADFRASFYGKNADEVGGAFNSVQHQNSYGDIGWGGVFGAKRVASSSSSNDSAWLVSSEKK